MGPIQLLFAKLLGERQAQEPMPQDPRNVDRREPESYSDFVRLFGQPPVSRTPPVMPFRDREQAGPSPPVGRLEMAYRRQK